MRLHHVQVACPPGGEAEARRFYGDGLGLAVANTRFAFGKRNVDGRTNTHACCPFCRPHRNVVARPRYTRPRGLWCVDSATVKATCFGCTSELELIV